jgi:hypothetical protein
MRIARVWFMRVALVAGATIGLAMLGGAPAVARPAAAHPAVARRAVAVQTAALNSTAPPNQIASVKHAFKLTVYPAYTTAGLHTTFEVTVANASSQGTMLRSVQVTPPTGFTVARPGPGAPFRRKTLVQKRTQTLREIALKPGGKVEFNVTATAPTGRCGKSVLRWTSRAFEGATPTGTQLSLQSAGTSAGVTVVCPQLAPCGDGGPACSTTETTNTSSYTATSNAGSGALHGTLDVGKRLKCGAYRFRDPNWYDSKQTLAANAPPTATGAPLVDVVSYTIDNAGTQGLGFCLGAPYEFTAASGAQAPAGTLPNGNAGFIGLLPMCDVAGPPCISSISQQADANAKTGYDAVLSIEIPEQGDPWGSG